jgi:hypothetical protein
MIRNDMQALLFRKTVGLVYSTAGKPDLLKLRLVVTADTSADAGARLFMPRHACKLRLS